ncbi:HAD-IIA family hydrolase [Rhodococcus sp. HNM0569]|nr:HAD-IIA family hydrolase [Rhodococcus sp. HNM0569]
MTSASGVLRESYDALLLDLDGTLYRGPHEIPGARDAVAAGGTSDTEQVLYVTNNASRPPEKVAEHLTELGFAASVDQVVTSAQSAARLLAEHLDAGARVLVVGTDALADMVAEAGLAPVRSFEDEPVAVVQGHSPETGWPILAEATLALRAGALWVAANVDSTLPTERGLVCGNGAMVAALRTATGRDPLVAGKPAAPLLQDALARSGSRRALVVGDRLDTDIEGAHAVGADSLLVLTGVSTPRDLVFARPDHRPTYVGETLDALNEPATRSSVDGPSGVEVSVRGDEIVVSPRATPAPDVRVLLDVARAAWANPDVTHVRSDDPTLAAVVASWRL